MNIILDTHTLIWYLEGNSSLSRNALGFIESKDNNIFVSIASLWEMSIKYKIGKLALSIPFQEINDYLLHYGIDILPISFDDILQNLNLEFHHKDPFDRMILSQAISNQFYIISNDENFKKYDANIIW